TVRLLTPHCRAAASAVAPQANAISRVSSAFLLSFSAIARLSSAPWRSLSHFVRVRPVPQATPDAGRSSGSLGLPAAELLVPADDDVGVERVEFHQERLAAGLLGADECAAAAAEEVQHVLAAARAVLDCPRRQFDGLFREVRHGLGVDLLDGPQV